MLITKCDKCGELSEPHRNEYSVKGFTRICLTVGYGGCVNKDLCDKCRAKLGIPKEKPQDNIAERLIDILSEIARDAVQE